MAAAALETNMSFKAGAEPRGAATGSMRILMIRMYQRSTHRDVFFASRTLAALALHTAPRASSRQSNAATRSGDLSAVYKTCFV